MEFIKPDLSTSLEELKKEIKADIKKSEFCWLYGHGISLSNYVFYADNILSSLQSELISSIKEHVKVIDPDDKHGFFRGYEECMNSLQDEEI